MRWWKCHLNWIFHGCLLALCASVLSACPRSLIRRSTLHSLLQSATVLWAHQVLQNTGFMQPVSRPWASQPRNVALQLNVCHSSSSVKGYHTLKSWKQQTTEQASNAHLMQWTNRGSWDFLSPSHSSNPSSELMKLVMPCSTGISDLKQESWPCSTAARTQGWCKWVHPFNVISKISSMVPHSNDSDSLAATVKQSSANKWVTKFLCRAS